MDHVKYLGTSYRHRGCGPEGCDCLGLVRWIYVAELGITLPEPPPYAEEWLYADVLRTGRRYFRSGFSLVADTPRLYDVLVLRTTPRSRLHLGLVIGSGYFLHATTEGVVCHPYTQGPYRTALSALIRHRRLS